MWHFANINTWCATITTATASDAFAASIAAENKWSGGFADILLYADWLKLHDETSPKHDVTRWLWWQPSQTHTHTSSTVGFALSETQSKLMSKSIMLVSVENL